PADPLAILPDLELAITGRYSLLPLPAADKTKSTLLKNSQRAGEEIDADIALVVPTSGSTGTPKGAQLTAHNLISSADATYQYLGGPGHWLLAMPAHHIAGLQVLIRSMVAGVEPLAIDVSAGFNISEFARATRELKETGERTYTSLAPMQLAKAMDTQVGIEALQSYDAVLVGGAATNPQLLESAARMQINVVTTYGSSETAGGCVYDGVALPGAQVRVDEGRIYLGGPTIAHGYRNAPGHEAFAEPGWFQTSDGGVLENGVLTVTGRLDNIIDSGGLKLHPEVLENAMLKVTGVDQACVVGIPHSRLGQAIVAAYTGNASMTDILEALEEAHTPRWQLPKDLKQLAEMPVTGPGKIDRQAVVKLFSP
ncbi:MAG TPA: o-succinylbenzoate--CoA ligase, partial [Corynebacterium stationis]|nr:o-succinylbenzoate--CoA ligase [Corynebacterium stationis]